MRPYPGVSGGSRRLDCVPLAVPLALGLALAGILLVAVTVVASVTFADHRLTDARRIPPHAAPRVPSSRLGRRPSRRSALGCGLCRLGSELRRAAKSHRWRVARRKAESEGCPRLLACTR